MLMRKPTLTLKKSFQKYFGPTHLRTLSLIDSNPGISLSELIYKLKITKQSINRVLRDLLKEKMVKQIKDEKDTRKKKTIH